MSIHADDLGTTGNNSINYYSSSRFFYRTKDLPTFLGLSLKSAKIFYQKYLKPTEFIFIWKQIHYVAAS